MSIFLLCLLVGVAVSRYINDDDDASEFLQPIISQTRQRRICAELCMAGLGGDPCGEGCVDLIPDGMPVQYAQTEQNNKTIPNVSYMTRHDMCDVLCNNNLGNPLCQCNNTGIVKQKSNFFEVCRMFCVKHKYRIYGCQKCDLYTPQSVGNFTVYSLIVYENGKATVNWKEWCVTMCSKGEGGVACNCDILPLTAIK